MKKVVNALIFNKNKTKILIVKRAGGLHSGKWAFPGGVIEKGETEEDALVREVMEETGLNVASILRKIEQYSYSSETGEKTKGTSYEVLTNNFKVQLNSESKEFKWASLEELENLDCAPGIKEEALKVFYVKFL